MEAENYTKEEQAYWEGKAEGQKQTAKRCIEIIEEDIKTMEEMLISDLLDEDHLEANNTRMMMHAPKAYVSEIKKEFNIKD